MKTKKKPNRTLMTMAKSVLNLQKAASRDIDEVMTRVARIEREVDKLPTRSSKQRDEREKKYRELDAIMESLTRGLGRAVIRHWSFLRNNQKELDRATRKELFSFMNELDREVRDE